MIVEETRSKWNKMCFIKFILTAFTLTAFVLDQCDGVRNLASLEITVSALLLWKLI